MRIEELEKEIHLCKRCGLYKNRKNAVPGEGNIFSRIILIGEAPGYHEDLQGRPFVGAAGKFLDELLRIVGIKRENVYITNVVKCRPPNNREPTDQEIKLCSKFLEKQITLIKPKLIITLGNVAKNYIFKKFKLKNEPISKIHGKVYKVVSIDSVITIIPMYHPAAGLYDPKRKDVILKDWLNVRDIIKSIIEENV